jgi:2-oxoglutarate ferredoxin oxidoreductase subunit beta
MTRQIVTGAQNTWCPGCGNFSIQHMLKQVFEELEKEGYPLENLVLVTGIGCHGKIADYMNINSFYSLHGRAVPVATGIKLANPDLKVICCMGDGDAYAEGLSHLLFAAKRNIDITVIIHDNRVYGLTTGQYTPTSPLHFKGRSTPHGTIEPPINPLELMLISGATYIARGYTRNLPLLKRSFREAIDHQGFSFIDVLQICASFYNLTEYYNERVYDLSGHDTSNFEKALEKMREWDYSAEGPIALGQFYQAHAATFDEGFHQDSQKRSERVAAIDRLLRSRE